MRNEKGQGALEYLLLIGGAVLVAAIVIVLLLNINATGTTSTTNTAMSAAAVNLAAVTTGKCTDFVADSPDAIVSGFMWNPRDNTCWLSSGTYPSCTAAKQTATVMTACCTAGSGCVATGGATANSYTAI